VDESYMVASGRAPSFGYYDHPPIAWWLSWSAVHVLGSDAPIVVRLPFIALFALSTWLMERLGRALGGARTGLWSAVLLNLSPLFGVTTGTWVLPDGPLDCALLGAALCLVRALERGSVMFWLGTGVCAGLALLSKYSAVLTIGGALIYLLTSRTHRYWLATPKPWLAALIALLMFSPVLVWNATHGWVSFAFQAARAGGGAFHPLAPLITLAGEALFVLPWLWLPMMVVLARAALGGPRVWRPWLLCCLAAPPIVLFAAVSAWAGQRVLFHWAAPGYLMGIPLLADALARQLHRPAVRALLAGTAGFVVLAAAGVAAQLHYDWLDGIVERFAQRDPDIEAADWTSLRQDLPPGIKIIGVPDWRNAGKIAYALGPAATVLCLNRDGRQFAITSPPERFIGADILILAPEHRERIAAELGPLFEHIERLADVSIRYGGRTLQSVAVFRGSRLKTWPPPG
jgi:4-amino-4-deoxy-L-arabinose transferase-like glycosyltransferase